MFKQLTRSVISRPSTLSFISRSQVTVTAALVKKLRDATNAPMMDCKKALTSVLSEDGVDTSSEKDIMGAATEYLRKRGSALASKNASRTAKEGVVIYAIAPGAKRGAVVEVNCETDFVARNPTFLAFSTRAAVAAVNLNADNTSFDATNNSKHFDMESFVTTKLPEGPFAMPTNVNAINNTVAEELIDVITSCRENIKVRRAGFVEVPAGSEGYVVPYIHNELPFPEELKEYYDQLVTQGYNIKFGGQAAICAITHESPVDEDAYQLTRKIAMQAVATQAEFLHRNNVPEEVVAKELEIIHATSDLSKKPADIVAKLVDGKMNKYYEGAVLLEQQFMITNDTVKKNLTELLSEHSSKPMVVELLRYQRGQGVVATDEE